MKIQRLFLLFLFAALCITGCKTTQPAGHELTVLPGQVPAWWNKPVKHDQTHLYFKAKGESFQSQLVARGEAMAAALQQIAQYVQADIKMHGEALDLASVIQINALEAQNEDYGAENGKQVVWLMLRYPTKDYQTLKQEIEARTKLRAELEALWKSAQLSAQQERDIAAEKSMRDIIAKYDRAAKPDFAVEDVKLALAEVNLRQGFNIRARRQLQDVIRSGNIPAAAKATAMLKNIAPTTLKDAFDGRPVRTYACEQIGDKTLALSPESGRLLYGQLRTAGVDADLSKVLLPQLKREKFDDVAAKAIAQSAKNAGCDAALVTFLRVDPALTPPAPRTAAEKAKIKATDATWQYYVIRASDGNIITKGELKGYSGAKDVLAETLVTSPRYLRGAAEHIALSLGY